MDITCARDSGGRIDHFLAMTDLVTLRVRIVSTGARPPSDTSMIPRRGVYHAVENHVPLLQKTPVGAFLVHPARRLPHRQKGHERLLTVSLVADLCLFSLLSAPVFEVHSLVAVLERLSASPTWSVSHGASNTILLVDKIGSAIVDRAGLRPT
jgi:hypothetical protein